MWGLGQGKQANARTREVTGEVRVVGARPSLVFNTSAASVFAAFSSTSAISIISAASSSSATLADACGDRDGGGGGSGPMWRREK